jgi:hypothetical protein
MLQFTDLNHFKHSIDVHKVTNVVLRPQNSDYLVAFHFGGSHVITAIVEKNTAEKIHDALATVFQVESPF